VGFASEGLVELSSRCVQQFLLKAGWLGACFKKPVISIQPQVDTAGCSTQPFTLEATFPSQHITA